MSILIRLGWNHQVEKDEFLIGVVDSLMNSPTTTKIDFPLAMGTGITFQYIFNFKRVVLVRFFDATGNHNVDVNRDWFNIYYFYRSSVG